MALIDCSECGREISDRAAQCVSCGAPVDGSQGGAASLASPVAAHSLPSNKFSCTSCGLADRTQNFLSVVGGELQLSSSSSDISLSAISNTVRHGRFQQALGTSWIQGTRMLRKGSITTTNISGTMETSGVTNSFRLKTWFDLIPPDDGSTDSAEGFRKLESELYCIRCDRFTGPDDGHARVINEVVAEAFGDYLLSFAEPDQYKQMVLNYFSNYSLHWLVKGEMALPATRNNSFEAAIDGLSATTPVEIETLISSQSDHLESQVAFLSFGNIVRLNLLQKEYVPGEAVLISSRSPSRPELNKLQLFGGFHMGENAAKLFKKRRVYGRWIAGRTDAILGATGISLEIT